MFIKKMIVGGALALLFSPICGAAPARELVMGLIPAENNEEIITKFEPMRLYLEKKLGQKVKIYTLNP